jgi:hypothetical protein
MGKMRGTARVCSAALHFVAESRPTRLKLGHDALDCVPATTSGCRPTPSNPFVGGDGGNVYLYYHGLIRKFASGTASIGLSGGNSVGSLLGTAGGLTNAGCSDGAQVSCVGFNKDLTRYPLDADVDNDGVIFNSDLLAVARYYNDVPGEDGTQYTPVKDILLRH